MSVTVILRTVAALLLRAPRFGVRRLLQAWRGPLLYIMKSSKWDALLLLVPGIMGVATGYRMRTDANSQAYLKVICYSVTSWPQHAPNVLFVCAVITTFLGVFRFSAIELQTKPSTTRYIWGLLLLVLANLVCGFTTIVVGGKIRSGLESSALSQLRDMKKEQSLLQLNTAMQEAWDVVQMQLGCCGVNGYKDYSSLYGTPDKQEVLPASCCAIKWQKEMPAVINGDQCQLDAKLGLRESIYINMPGCVDHLSAWLKHYLYAQVFCMMGASVSQVIALMYVYGLHVRPARELQAGS